MLKLTRAMLTMLLLLAAVGLRAQVTTSALSGKVTDLSAEAVIGATVKAVHEPSGTMYGAITNADGRYTIQGMRAGGPYKVEITYVGYETVTFSQITLNLGETANVSAQMKESSEVLSEVVVVGKSGIDATKTGAAMSISSDDITCVSRALPAVPSMPLPSPVRTSSMDRYMALVTTKTSSARNTP